MQMDKKLIVLISDDFLEFLWGTNVAPDLRDISIT